MNSDKPEVIDYYQPPTAVPLADVNVQNGTLFYVVSKKKFYTLFIATFSLYGIYWAWQQWSDWRQASGDKIWPVVRAIFSIFFTHSLFNKIENRANLVEGHSSKSLNLYATLYVIGVLSFNFMDNISMIGVVYIAITIVSVGLLAYVVWQGQNEANIASLDSEGTSNSSFTVANYIWIALGAIVWIVILAGVAMAPFEEF